MREPSVPRGLKTLYSKLLGERDRIKSPPKRLLRLKSDREAYAAAALDRALRMSQIEEALPHFAYVIQWIDPSWDPAAAEPIRPREVQEGAPPVGFVTAAFAVLWKASCPMTIAEVAGAVSDRYGVPLSDVPKRQRYHTAVNNALMHYRDQLVCDDDGYPLKWALKARAFSETNESPA